eukprot:2351680-Rhodomonas_salina.1
MPRTDVGLNASQGGRGLWGCARSEGEREGGKGRRGGGAEGAGATSGCRVEGGEEEAAEGGRGRERGVEEREQGRTTEVSCPDGRRGHAMRCM